MTKLKKKVNLLSNDRRIYMGGKLRNMASIYISKGDKIRDRTLSECGIQNRYGIWRDCRW